uniref:Cytochrome b5 heme-binding domain-containing protein n=1 Tax=Phaeomonas parva TaxID=124430 RepID=A0A7S1XXM8_9STRA|mmetsp:Transcript_42602/g.133521  ORF Transcript_42602/g.133521 Transcript_42602/m.133521 type:complete len:273 (+) Transcript_42602:101-919(+)
MPSPLVPDFIQRVADMADANPLYALGVTVALCATSWILISGSTPPKPEEPKEEPPKPRNFTLEQLKAYRSEDDGGIFIAIKGEVFDVSAKAELYGPGGNYEALTGREASRALAKFALEGPDLESTKIDDLNYGEREQLDGWYEKFKHVNEYPVRGRVVTPPGEKLFTEAQLRAYTGTQAVPEGYAAAPLYIAVRRRIYDVSFGNLTEMYLPGGPYAKLAGRDGNRALGKMSLKEEDMFSRDISDFTDDQNQILDDWAAKFAQRYPCVGTLKD